MGGMCEECVREECAREEASVMPLLENKCFQHASRGVGTNSRGVRAGRRARRSTDGT